MKSDQSYSKDNSHPTSTSLPPTFTHIMFIIHFHFDVSTDGELLQEKERKEGGRKDGRTWNDVRRTKRMEMKGDIHLHLPPSPRLEDFEFSVSSIVDFLNTFSYPKTASQVTDSDPSFLPPLHTTYILINFSLIFLLPTHLFPSSWFLKVRTVLSLCEVVKSKI